MKLNYFYNNTRKIEELLKKIEVAKGILEYIPQLTHVENNLRRKSLLKSSVFSARIEGNKLTYDKVKHSNLNSKDLEKKEIQNILTALQWLYSKNSQKTLNKNLILNLHTKVMSGITKSGKFRNEFSGVFNSAGNVVYFAPPPNEVPNLILELINTTNKKHSSTPTKSAVFHFTFEKIHPFLDGNGRVGRLLSTFILKQKGYDFRGLISLEEYMDTNKQTYYDLLNIEKRDITQFVEFFLQGLVIQSEKVLEELKKTKYETEEDTLLPRRREILELIEDHKLVSFNFIKRRFLNVPNSTLHYDLKKLEDENFIKKIGETRGALYTSIN
ncbi:hypothetical protein COV24_04130 [candidate division WWE3 bacterium CG10_big_fil_rev_8_21_14_0_10_32_10]|uniref:Fido domain-containing protein n=1 Tax=candidate division WWE3 bacterium CG10_big_fil_rev_8_21_14_0_10_32_10 TaxID=1975090 RepID=A0A2H0RB00_UNCKA|nr:MAG: hypothetical protein COV24_04130 [candidate division WWE3 bacterium CG10_big_fil_rev_8_21_14_0_10_32_10]